MQERFKRLLEEKQLTATRFAAIIKVNASAMSHILNGRSKPGFDVLDKIAQAFPDVNLNWLISGKGEIFTTPVKKPEIPPLQSRLFEQEEKKEPVPQPATEIPTVKAAPAAETVIPAPALLAGVAASKKLKRIILFFDDGSFEDYLKD